MDCTRSAPIEVVAAVSSNSPNPNLSSSAPAAAAPKKTHITGDGPKMKEGSKVYDSGKYEEYVKIGKQLEK